MSHERVQLTGKTFGPVKRTVSEEDIREFLKVTGEKNPAYDEDHAAALDGHPRRLIPPSFAPLVALGILRAIDWERDFLLDIRKGTVMSGEQELKLSRPIYLGETVTVRGQIVDVSSKRGKRPFDVARIEVRGSDEGGFQVFSGAISCILMGWKDPSIRS